MVQAAEPGKRASILIVDDEISNIEIMFETLGDDYEICFATSGEQALEQMQQFQPDLVLLDVVMQGMQGFEVCARMKAEPLLRDVPVIFITGLNDTEDEVRGLSIGAIDYVTKPIHPLILRTRVRNHIELKRLRDHLTELAATDALTGLPNRRRIDSQLQLNVQKLAPSGGWLSVLMLDLDFFKQFNDAYGHQSGDNCLKMVSAALNRAAMRVGGQPARYGGEEFCCILPNCPPGQAATVAMEIRYQLQQMRIPHERSEVGPFVTISIGLASAEVGAGMEPADWIRQADGQLSLAKAGGRDRIKRHVFSQLETASPA